MSSFRKWTNFFWGCFGKILEKIVFLMIWHQLWKIFHLIKIDAKKPGFMGYVTNLFMCFKSVLNFRFIYSEEFDCDDCSYNNIESNKYHGSIISITKQSRKQSFHQSYLELMQPKCYVCRFCTKKRISISKTIEV